MRWQNVADRVLLRQSLRLAEAAGVWLGGKSLPIPHKPKPRQLICRMDGQRLCSETASETPTFTKTNLSKLRIW